MWKTFISLIKQTKTNTMKIAISVLKELSEQEHISAALWSKHPIDAQEIEEVLYYAKKINEQLLG